MILAAATPMEATTANPAKPGYRGSDVENNAPQVPLGSRRELKLDVARWCQVELHGFLLIFSIGHHRRQSADRKGAAANGRSRSLLRAAADPRGPRRRKEGR